MRRAAPGGGPSIVSRLLGGKSETRLRSGEDLRGSRDPGLGCRTRR